MSRLFRAAGAISGLTLGSRVLGLWRDSAMAAVLGAGPVSDTFFLAWALPNLMRRLLGEGALSASFVPAYTAARRDGEAPARGLLASVLGGVLVLLLPLVALVVVGSLLATLWSGGDDGRLGLLLTLNAILFPYAIPICVTAMLAGALNTRGVFALPAAVPIALNVVWIGALYLVAPLGIAEDSAIATFLAAALCAGGFAQLLLVIAPLRRAGALASPPLRWPRRGTAAAMVFATMGPTVVGMSLNQISTLIDQGMAYGLLGEGANTYLYLSNRLLLFPHALTALAVVVAVFPRLADEAGERDRARLRTTIDGAAAATLFVTVPAAMGLFVLADDVVAGLFQRQQFTAEDAAATALTTRCLLVGLPFLGLAQLFARAFYAVGDTRTPARVAARLLLVNVGLNLVLILGLGFGTEGLALATSCSGALNALWLARGLRRHVAAAPAGALSPWLRSGVATAAMCAAILLVRPEVDGGRGALLLWRVALPIAVGIAVYAAAQWLLRSPELRAVLRRRR
ncbi:MAG: murein biosynthesis integral membrane protein MurJ [Planctomycetota bacterium]